MALAAAEIKHGMLVVGHPETNAPGQWEVLDKHPGRAYWWLHRWNAAGEWETTCAHQNDLHRVANGSRHEYEQPEMEIAA
jgi:hypothetical protein